MSFLGKEFNFEKIENAEGFVNTLGLSEERKAKLLKSKYPKKLVKNADGTYTLNAHATFNFKSGEEFVHQFPDSKTAKITITVDGNKMKQVNNFNEMTVTVESVFSDSDLVETLTNSKWDGVAKVYYKA